MYQHLNIIALIFIKHFSFYKAPSLTNPVNSPPISKIDIVVDMNYYFLLQMVLWDLIICWNEFTILSSSLSVFPYSMVALWDVFEGRQVGLDMFWRSGRRWVCFNFIVPIKLRRTGLLPASPVSFPSSSSLAPEPQLLSLPCQGPSWSRAFSLAAPSALNTFQHNLTWITLRNWV